MGTCKECGQKVKIPWYRRKNQVEFYLPTERRFRSDRQPQFNKLIRLIDDSYLALIKDQSFGMEFIVRRKVKSKGV